MEESKVGGGKGERRIGWKGAGWKTCRVEEK